MSPSEYAEQVKNLKIGKALPDAIYAHRSVLQAESPELYKLVSAVARALKIEDEWNLAKLFKKEYKLSLLNYPSFYTESYPALETSNLVDLETFAVRQTNYNTSDNPPILHRKELMILPSDPHFDMFSSLTREGEEAGLYHNTLSIGFKQNWERAISDAGYEMVNGHIKKAKVPLKRKEQPDIDRHLTAIIRHDLSTPFKTLIKSGLLRRELSVFDYGCGRGDDIRELEAHGIDVAGWDPAFAPDNTLIESDIVNIGFVINVIEDPIERIEALQKAHALSRKVTVVSAMIAGETTISKFKPFGDGILTSRNTFQKYYSQGELQEFIETCLETDAVAAGPGIFLVFKDKNDEQAFFLNKNKRTKQWTKLSERPEVRGSHELQYVKNRELLDEFWAKCLELGRLPLFTEFDQSEALEQALGSIQKAYRIVNSVLSDDDLRKAAELRTEDLTVYFALALFGKRPQYKTMPTSLRQDLKIFFGNYKTATEIGRDALFKISDVNEIAASCVQATGILPSCRYVEGDYLITHTKYIQLLPQLLRIYVGAAEQALGSAEDFQLIKIHISSGKVTFLLYENFETTPLPVLIERVKVNLRKQEIDFFDYVEPYTPPPLYWKASVIDESFEDFKKQVAFDKKLKEQNIVDETKEFGPDRGELDFELRLRGLKIVGYRFHSIKGKQ